MRRENATIRVYDDPVVSTAINFNPGDSGGGGGGGGGSGVSANRTWTSAGHHEFVYWVYGGSNHADIPDEYTYVTPPTSYNVTTNDSNTSGLLVHLTVAVYNQTLVTHQITIPVLWSVNGTLLNSAKSDVDATTTGISFKANSDSATLIAGATRLIHSHTVLPAGGNIQAHLFNGCRWYNPQIAWEMTVSEVTLQNGPLITY